MARSLSSSPLVTFTDPEMALITLLLRSGEGTTWGCGICGQRFSCSASLNTHVLTVGACGGVLAELNGKGVFGLASTYACLAAADWEGNKEMIECYVGLWERGEIDRNDSEDEDSDSSIEGSDSDDPGTESNPYGFPSKPPSKLTGAQKAEYVKCLDRLNKMDTFRATYLPVIFPTNPISRAQTQSNRVHNSAALLKEWNARYGKKGGLGKFERYESFCGRRQKDVQKLRSFCSVQAGGNTIPKDPMNGKEYAGSRGADLGYGNVGASNAVKACRNGHMKGGKGPVGERKGKGGTETKMGLGLRGMVTCR